MRRKRVLCMCGQTNDGQHEKRSINGKKGYRHFSSIANIISSRIPTPICTRILSTMRWQVPRRIEMRETKRRKKKKMEEERKDMEQRGQKGSPGIMATTLRSGLRAPKSRPVSMPRHRHSFERRCVMRVSPILSEARRRSGSPPPRSVRPQPRHNGTKLCQRPMPAAVPLHRSPSVAFTAAELLAISCCVSGILLS